MQKHSLAAFGAAVRSRLPGGYIFGCLNPRYWFSHYSLRTALRCELIVVAMYFLGGKRFKRPIQELRPPYPALYHYTIELNRESILKQGILPNHGEVYMTDWTDVSRLGKFDSDTNDVKVICFQIDPEHLAACGHPVSIIPLPHEFTTDFVPPNCLTLTDMCDGRVR